MQKQRIYWGSAEASEAVEAAFAAGKAVLAESDTVWGLLAPATKAGAQELDRLKKRRDKPYLVLMGSLEAVEAVAHFPSNGSLELAQKAWPGPLTLLIPEKLGKLPDALSLSGLVGIRVPDHESLRRAAAVYNGLFSTSANISGEPVPSRLEDIPVSIRAEVGTIIYNDPSYTSQTQPSTIVDCSGLELKVIRHGAYSIAD
jgi:L-threonylcarbamoyladenylate synthase